MGDLHSKIQSFFFYHYRYGNAMSTLKGYADVLLFTQGAHDAYAGSGQTFANLGFGVRVGVAAADRFRHFDSKSHINKMKITNRSSVPQASYSKVLKDDVIRPAIVYQAGYWSATAFKYLTN